MPLETLDVSSIGTRRALDLALANDAPFLLASTSEIYGDPLVHPQPETYQRQRRSDRPARGLRRSQAVRRDAHDDVPPPLRPPDRGSCASSTRTARACARPTGASSRTSWCRRSPASRSRCTARGTQTRSFCYVDDEVRGILALFDSDVVEPVNIGNPIEFTMLELAELVCEVAGASREFVFEPLPVGDPTRRQPDITRARSSSWAGSRRSSCAKDSSARTPGTWRSAPVAAA